MANFSVNGKVLEKISITCNDCGTEFEMFPAEQRFYIGKGFEMPKTCPECRKKKKEVTTITCVDCGVEFTMTNREIEYFTSKDMQIPKRCPDCRAYKRQRNVNKGCSTPQP